MQNVSKKKSKLWKIVGLVVIISIVGHTVIFSSPVSHGDGLLHWLMSVVVGLYCVFNMIVILKPKCHE